ncbi:MAG: hypothetical protein V2I33_25925 [Kangiellaceae bacterium]|jgi:hypothetical protein|nr:hypothetical protein [Kangiellaceae bacterium]
MIPFADFGVIFEADKYIALSIEVNFREVVASIPIKFLVHEGDGGTILLESLEQ